MISRELLSPGIRCDISPCPISDHDFVSLVFDTTGVKRGPGVWNLNNSLDRLIAIYFFNRLSEVSRIGGSS